MRKKKKLDYVKPSLEPLSGPGAVHASSSSGSTQTGIQWGCIGTGASAGTCPGGPSAAGVCGPGGSTAMDQQAEMTLTPRGGVSQQQSF